MSARNLTTLERAAKGELIPTKVAVKLLGFAGANAGKGQGAFLAAVKSHDYLKAGKVEKTEEVPMVLWERSAIERYAAERKSGGSPRDGAKWFSARLSADEAARLSDYASQVFGREVTFEQPAVRAARIAAAKAAFTNGQVDEDVETDETDEDLEDVEA